MSEVTDNINKNPEYYGESGAPLPNQGSQDSDDQVHVSVDPSIQATIETLMGHITDYELVSKEISESTTLKILREVLQKDAEDSIKDFAYADLSDTKALLRLQAAVYRNEQLKNVLLGIEERAKVAAQKLSDMGV